MIFDPKPTKYPFPEYTDQHYLVVKKNNGIVFDKNYKYIDRSKGFRFKQFLVRLLLIFIVFPLTIVKMGLRIKGRKNLKIHKDILKNGVISCSNHVHLWDYIAIMKAVRPVRTNILTWAKNVRGENAALIRLTGGIPIPEGDFEATKTYLRTVKELLMNKGWLHISAEGSMWEYYAPIRPFKKGAGYFAVQCNKPILPIGFSFRKPSWIRKHILKQYASITLTIGEPIFPDESLPIKEREKDIVTRAHAAVCRLAGIDPAENLYPPIFNDDKRIDYYPLSV